MHYFNLLLNRLFDLVMLPVRGLDPFWSLFIISFPAGIVLLLIFRYTSDQKKIREAKDMIRGYMLEMRLFKDSPAILFSSLGNILAYNFKYMKHALKPLLVMMVPVIFILIQLDAWYGHMPLKPGESALISVKLNGKGSTPGDIALRAGSGVTVETPPLRIARDGEVNWRVRADERGDLSLAVVAGGLTVEKTLTSADGLGRVSKTRTGAGILASLFNPGEESIPGGHPVEEISIRYPERSISFLGWKMHWIVVFLVVTIIAGYSFKNVFKVEI